MKIAITGHTRGIGLACYQLLEKSHNVIGFSTSNGYDIADAEKIYQDAKDCDILINSAYNNGYAQTDLLSYFFKQWEKLPRQIISIGSSVTCYPRIEKELDLMPWPYREHKVSLEQQFRILAKLPSECNLNLIIPGAVDTGMISHLTCNKLSTSTVAETVNLVIQNPLLREIVIYEK